ncbi:MAG: radical SAM protein [Spirochaetia bacterium]
MLPGVKIKEVQTKNLITKSNLPDADYVINPYTGCLHSCIYCYARFMKRFTGHNEPWGRFVDVKVNAADAVPKNGEKYKNKAVFMSSVTDPYLELEKKYELTRRVLGRIVGFEPALSIQTKSALITRDIDLLQGFKLCRVGMTVTTLDDTVRAAIEPHASPVADRLSALKKLKQNGLSTYVFIGPVLPFITDWREIIRRTRDFTDCYYFENLNMYGTIKKDLFAWLEGYNRNRLASYLSILRAPAVYWEAVKQEITEYCTVHGITYKLYFDHKAIRKTAGVENGAGRATRAATERKS